MLRLIAATALVFAAAGAQTQPGRGPDVRYVANAGILLAVDGRRFLIDAPIRDGIAPYATSPAAERALLETARPPYDGVDAILVTHWHEDHFSAAAVASLLAHSPRTILISSPDVVNRVRDALPNLPSSRVRAVLPEPGRSQLVEIAGVPVHVLRVRHNPTRAGRFPEQHVAFLVGRRGSVLHVGDADPAADNFTGLSRLPAVDLACLPFWYVSDTGNRRMVATAIRPRRIVAVHVPPGDVGKVATALRDAAVRAVVAASPGSPLPLPD